MTPASLVFGAFVGAIATLLLLLALSRMWLIATREAKCAHCAGTTLLDLYCRKCSGEKECPACGTELEPKI